MEHHTFAEQDVFCRNQMQEIAIQAVETTDAQRQLHFQEAGEETPKKRKTGQVLWSITSRAVRRIRVWSLRPAIESEKASIAKPRTVSVA